MRLSIITINLNNASGLRRTIESVVAQTSREFEYIVIDGASSDGSVDVIKEYADKISNWLSEPDSGVYNAMNKGIRMSNGDYCQFLNSGDWLAAPDVTEQMLHDMPKCSIVYGNMLKQMPDGKVLHNRQIIVHSLLTFYKGTLNHSPVYILRSLFDKYGLYDESLRIVSDWKFYLIAIGLNNEPVVYRNIDVTCFDMNGISNSNNTLDKAERRKVLEEVLPANILADYDLYSTGILEMNRINRYRLTHWFFWFVERILFKCEKLKTHRNGEHLFY